MALLRIAIPFFDRVWLFRHCLATLAKLKQKELIDFAVYLDHGYQPEALQAIAELLPEAHTIASDYHLGASGSAHRILADYADDPATERLLLLDADMIVRTDLAASIFEWPVRGDMIISVYNSCEHQPVFASSAPFVHKRRLGATGTLWSADIARLVTGNLPSQEHYDDKFCELCRSRGIPLCCSNLSLAQHLGVFGKNNNTFGHMDYGLNYLPDGPEQVAAMAEVFNHMMANQSFYLGHSQ